MEPGHFRIRQSQRLITGQAGLVLAGQALSRFAQLPQQLDPRFPVRGTALATSDMLKSYVGLLCQGKSDFEAIEAYRGDAFFTTALGLRGVPSTSRLRQRLDALAGAEALEAIDGLSERLLARAEAPITAVGTGHVALDIDVFVMDNSASHKEGVSRTYAGVEGYAPIGAYLGGEGWCVGLELREGRTHSAGGTEEVLARALADATLAWHHPREGKRTAVFEDRLERRGSHGEPIGLRRVLSVTERTIDRHGQHLLVPAYEVEGYLTTLEPEAAEAETVIALYRDHATHEQFHSELKTDLDLERLPSGKFATNDLVLSLSALAYNVLRLIGQNALTGPDAPPRHPAKRRRLRTVIQEFMMLAAAVSEHARQRFLVFGTCSPALGCFQRLHRQWAGAP